MHTSIFNKIENPEFLIIDLFCGAGGVTTGFEMTGGIAKVIACVNHDHVAILSHWANYKDNNYGEDSMKIQYVQFLHKLPLWEYQKERFTGN